jgi:hypothetical protein
MKVTILDDYFDTVRTRFRSRSALAAQARSGPSG